MLIIIYPEIGILENFVKYKPSNMVYFSIQWMPVEDYAAQPFVQENELFDFIAKICLTKLDGNYTGFSSICTSTSSGKRTYLYFNNDTIASHLLASKHE